MSLRAPTENENGNACRCIRFGPLPPRRGKIEMGVQKENLRSPLPCLPRQGEGIKSRCRSAFSARLAATLSKESTKITKEKKLVVAEDRPR